MYLKSNTRNKGFGLPVAIFVITVLAMVVVAMTRMDEASSLSFGQNFYSVKAFYAAESGAQVALAKSFPAAGTPDACISNFYTRTFAVGGTNVPGLNGCSVSVSCTFKKINKLAANEKTFYTFISTATCGAGSEQTKRIIEVRARD